MLHPRGGGAKCSLPVRQITTQNQLIQEHLVQFRAKEMEGLVQANGIGGRQGATVAFIDFRKSAKDF